MAPHDAGIVEGDPAGDFLQPASDKRREEFMNVPDFNVKLQLQVVRIHTR
jgi:hypothetical protein